jgi:hypothetical protein
MEPVYIQAASYKMLLSCHCTYDNKMGREKVIFTEVLQIYIIDCFDSIIEIKSDNIGTGASECK